MGGSAGVAGVGGSESSTGGVGGGGGGGSGGTNSVCAAGWVMCDSLCIDPERDLKFCGASDDCSGENRGRHCADREQCVDGHCPGAWQEPEELATDGQNMGGLVLAMNDAGNAVIGWSNLLFNANPNVWGGYYSIEAGWSTQVVDDWVEGEDLRLVIDSAGNATLVWVDLYFYLRSAHYVAGSGWQETTGPLASAADATDVAMDGSGAALVVWADADGLWANRHAPDAGWGSTGQPVQQEPGGTAPRIAMNPSGDTLVVWSQEEEELERLWSSHTDAGGTWTTPEPIQDTPASYLRVADLAIDVVGNGLAVWDEDQRTRVWVNRFSAGMGWQGAELLDATAVDASAPRVAMDADGNAIAVWLRTDDATQKVWASRYTLASGWGSPELISGTAASCDDPRIAVGASGDAVAVWNQSDPAQAVAGWSNRFTPGVGWADPEFVSFDTGKAWSLDVGVDANGNAIAVWDNDRDEVWVNHSKRPQ